MSRSRSSKRSTPASPRSAAAARPAAPAKAPRPAPFARTVVAPGTTGTFLDELPLGAAGDVEAADVRGRTAFASTRSASELVTLFVRFTAIQPLRSQSLAGNIASAPRTDYIGLHGSDRFWMLERKVRGVLRTFISRYMRPSTCSDAETRFNTKKGMCGKCFVCRLFGHFANNAQSRLVVSDFYSEQLYDPTQVGSLAVHSGNSFLRVRDMAPPGTTFQGLITLRRPTKLDIGTVVAALEMAAMHEGFGSETTHYGRCQVEFLGVAGGYLNRIASAVPLVEAVARGETPQAALEQAITAHGYAVPVLYGAAAQTALETLAKLSPVHPAFEG